MGRRTAATASASAIRAAWTAARLDVRARGAIRSRGSTREFASSSSRRAAVDDSPGTSSDDAPPDVRSSFQYCVQRVRQHDYEAYLCTLALPKEHRLTAMALRAFNVETAQALGATKEPHLALMRLRWWKDAVAAAAGDRDATPPPHPVAIALHSALHASMRDTGGVGARHRRWLNAIVDARIRDAELDSPPPGIPFLEAYADQTHASLLYLILDACGVRNSDADHAAAHLGKAIGIANLLRGAHAHAKQRRCYLPADVCARHGAATEDVYRARPTEGVRDAVHEVASTAKAHLDGARAMAPRLARAGSDGGRVARAALLPAVGTGRYLEALEAKDFDVFHPELVRGANPIVTQGRIAWAAFRGTY